MRLIILPLSRCYDDVSSVLFIILPYRGCVIVRDLYILHRFVYIRSDRVTVAVSPSGLFGAHLFSLSTMARHYQQSVWHQPFVDFLFYLCPTHSVMAKWVAGCI